ncbi:MAG: hypothetical protein R3E53_01600 [Myxococcota bacterium]
MSESRGVGRIGGVRRGRGRLAYVCALGLACLAIAFEASAACQSGDSCGGLSACTAGCVNYTCGPGGFFQPAGVLPSGAPCQGVTTGACQACTCGSLGAQIISNLSAGTSCGTNTTCELNTCNGSGVCQTSFASSGTVCGTVTSCESNLCDGAGACAPSYELPGTTCGANGETCDGGGMCVAPPPAAGALNPGALLVYYGIPSLINGAAGDLDVAAATLGAYDVVVLGAGLEVPAGQPGHLAEHANTVAIVARPAMTDTLVFGYIDLGVANTTGPLSNFAIAEIVQRADWWLNEVGADGIFLDDYGYDFCVSRQRQNDAIAGIRALSTGAPIPIVANAFRPDDVFGTQTTHAFATPWCDATVPDPVFVPNPGQIASLLSADDYYFYESHQLINGDFEANDYAFDWQFKSQYLANAQASLDFGILSTTTIDGADVYDELAFFYSWYSAALYGHDATGWGEVLFSAPTSQAPFRARPAVDVGDVFLTSPGQSVDFVEWSRDTDAGRIWIDTQTHESGFVPEPAGGAALAAGLLGLHALARLRRRSARG